ncbi:PepSY-associated TM helix domain-containing protein [Shinella sp.]|uniref:PepSY-associated TM helix domain-containing protein n=1 Tax=Shinella sp. TaxID=1870904 RepID=UPI0039E56F41
MRAKSRSSAQWWFLAHSWLALPIWAFLFFVCLTGTIATVSQEIVWLARPEVRANAPSGDARMLGYDEIIAVVTSEHPDAVVQRVSRPVKSMFAWSVLVEYPDASAVDHYVNPYTGHIQGSELPGFSFRQFIRALHGWLLVPFNDRVSLGWYAVSLLSLPLLGSLVTGLVVYKRFWRGFLSPRLRLGHGARVFWGDLHRLAGIWSIPFILIMAVTGLWFLTDQVLKHADIDLPSTSPALPVILDRDAVPLAPPGGQVARVGLDRAAQVMRETFPEVEASFFSLGEHAFSPIRVMGQGAGWPLLTEAVWINPYSGSVEYARSVGNRSWLELVTQSMRPLHTGDFVGLGLKLVYFFFGLLLTAMVASGLLIWTKRTAKATAAVLPPAVGRIAARWRRWRFHLSALLLVLPMVWLPHYLSQNKPAARAGLGQRVAGQFDAGPWSVTLAEWRNEPPRPHDDEYEKVFMLALSQDSIAQVKAVYVRLGQPRGDVRTSGVLASGSPYRMRATVHMPAEVDPAAELWLTLEGWDGSKHRVAVPLAQASPETARWAQARRQ